MKDDKFIWIVMIVALFGAIAIIYCLNRDRKITSNYNNEEEMESQLEAPINVFYDTAIRPDSRGGTGPNNNGVGYRAYGQGTDFRNADYRDSNRNFHDSNRNFHDSNRGNYKLLGTQPIRGVLGVPVPQGTLKESSEYYKKPFYDAQIPLAGYDYFRPYGPNQESMQAGIVLSDTPFYDKRSFDLLSRDQGSYDRRMYNTPSYNPQTISPLVYNPISLLPTASFRNPNANQEGMNAVSGGGGNFYAANYTGSGAVPFIGSVSSFAPFPEVVTGWEKIGILTSENNNEIMNLYRRPIAPLQDLFEYSAQDKNGFIIRLRQQYIENGELINHIDGKEKGSPWKAVIYINNKYVWV